jgi:hypothetical protein
MWYPNEELCPETIRESLTRYVEHGVPPGDFLRAVLENDLKEAIGRADYINGPSIHHIVSYLYNSIPSTAWGSPEAVEAWLAAKREERAAANE